MFLHGALEDISLLSVEFGNTLGVGFEPIVAPRIEKGEDDGLAERRRL